MIFAHFFANEKMNKNKMIVLAVGLVGLIFMIKPWNIQEGNTVIGRDCVIRQNTRIKDVRIADRVEIESSVILESSIGSGTTVGPFAYLRPHTKVGAGCKVGDFVEMKNSSFGDGSKAASDLCRRRGCRKRRESGLRRGLCQL